MENISEKMSNSQASEIQPAKSNDLSVNTMNIENKSLSDIDVGIHTSRVENFRKVFESNTAAYYM